MGPRTPPLAPPGPGDHGPRDRPCPEPRPHEAKAGGPDLISAVGPALVRTVRHFFPDLPQWLNDLPDTRFQPMVDYPAPFLLWWGIALFLFKLGARRQLDYELRNGLSQILPNLNRLAGTMVTTLPVHQTLDHYLGHLGSPPLADLRSCMMHRLIRMKALEDARLENDYMVAFDGTGLLTFSERHCDHCLTATQDGRTHYFHTVLEAKVLSPSGLALSIGSEFIENPQEAVALPVASSPAPAVGKEVRGYGQMKQDCELKAFARLARAVKRDFPQLRICLAGDALFACGPVFAIAKKNEWSYVLTLKEDRLPTVWKEFQTLSALTPENTHSHDLMNGTQRTYRWVNDLTHVDEQGRRHTLAALSCEEKRPAGARGFFAWVTDKKVSQHNVAEVAAKGGRLRFKIENEGFNVQKNSGLNLEHAYSHDWELEKAYYFLLQLGHLLLQLLERGSLLEGMARSVGKSVVQLFGSLKNIARRLLECFRFVRIPEVAFDPTEAGRIRIRLDTS